jgi:hypothetical protein
MKQTRWVLLLGSVMAMTLPFLAVQGQQPGPRPGFRPMMQGGPPAFNFMDRKVVTGAPYSAEATLEHTQTLPDSNLIDQKFTANIYRDGQGRTRIEESRSSRSGNPQQIVRITDPVAHVSYILDSGKKVARRFTLPAPPNGNPPQGPRNQSNPNVTTESLGSKNLNGLLVEGTQITRTIPAGRMGNTSPVQITTTRWYSPDLSIDLSTHTSDPLRGNSTTTLSNISREEPSSTLFEVPSDYKIVSGRRPSPRFAPPAPPQEKQ